jgi:hypothetical protein
VSGFVYFIACEPLGAVKIGFTKQGPISRLAALQTGSPARLKLLTYFPGDLSDEARLHKAFAPLHISGEWFRHECKLEDFVNWVSGHGERVQSTREAFENALHDVLMQNGGWVPFHPIKEEVYAATGDWEPFRELIWEVFGPWDNGV